jgi:hypothetical protein
MQPPKPPWRIGAKPSIVTPALQAPTKPQRSRPVGPRYARWNPSRPIWPPKETVRPKAKGAAQQAIPRIYTVCATSLEVRSKKSFYLVSLVDLGEPRPQGRPGWSGTVRLAAHARVGRHSPWTVAELLVPAALPFNRRQAGSFSPGLLYLPCQVIHDALKRIESERLPNRQTQVGIRIHVVKD